MAVAYQRRTAPDNQTVKSLLDKGTLGRVFAADLSAKFYRDQNYYDCLNTVVVMPLMVVGLLCNKLITTLIFTHGSLGNLKK